MSSSYFKLPPWATTPAQPGAALLPASSAAALAPVDVGTRPAFTLGADPSLADVPLPPQSGASPVHAALVHHQDGRPYLIDLDSASGTRVNGQAIPPNKPTRLYDGAALQFGGGAAGGAAFTYRAGPCEPPPSSSSSAPSAPPQGIIRASHLLVKHRDVRRPSSHREPDGVTRSRADAWADVSRLEREIREKAGGSVAGLAAVFAEVAARESHCSSYKRGGDLGPFGPGQMQQAFDAAARGLGVGEMSGPVESDSGVHLILRTA
jgi:peptidyl-prolyl cis-trans isomerase NIMA-interacting 1